MPLPLSPVLPRGLSGRLSGSIEYSPSELTRLTSGRQEFSGVITKAVPVNKMVELTSKTDLLFPDVGQGYQGVQPGLPPGLHLEVGEVGVADLGKKVVRLRGFTAASPCRRSGSTWARSPAGRWGGPPRRHWILGGRTKSRK